jgi:hypothetical protein
MIKSSGNQSARKRSKSKATGTAARRAVRKKRTELICEPNAASRPEPIALAIPTEEALCTLPQPVEQLDPFLPAPEENVETVSVSKDLPVEPILAPENFLALAPSNADAEIPVEKLVTIEPEKYAALEAASTPAGRLPQILKTAWNWIQERLQSQQPRKRLRVCETVSLGEKRFIAVVQVDGEQFLVGGSSNSVSTLAHLDKARGFSEVLGQSLRQDLGQA